MAKPKNKRGAVFQLPELASAQCADGEIRPNWIAEGGQIACLVPPGTPIVECEACGARVCAINTGKGTATLEHGAGYGDETNDFYAPEHNCKLL